MTYRKVVGIAIALALSLSGIALAVFVQTQRLGPEVTPSSRIWFQLLGATLIACLLVSLIYSIWGFVVRRWQPFALAAILSGTFSVFAILSVGWLTLVLTIAQIVLATAYSRIGHWA